MPERERLTGHVLSDGTRIESKPKPKPKEPGFTNCKYCKKLLKSSEDQEVGICPVCAEKREEHQVRNARGSKGRGSQGMY